MTRLPRRLQSNRVSESEGWRSFGASVYAGWRAHATLTDCAFLITVVALSAVLYVDGLGFHGDDWGYFLELSKAGDQSFRGLTEGLYARDAGLQQRPAQLAYVVTTYFAFGLNPLGYHIVGAAMLLVIALVLYAIFKELGQPRAFAVLVPALYVLLPNYSGARLWFGAHTALLSVVFLVLSAYAVLRALRSRRLFIAWLALGALALVASGLAYEVTLPVFALIVAAIVVREARVAGLRSVVRSTRVVAVVATYSMALLAALAFKAYVTTRVGINEPYGDYLARIARGSVQVNFGAYGIGIPYIVSWIALHTPSAKVFALAVGLGTGSGLYLASLVPVGRAEMRAISLRYVVGGLCLFLAGCAIFIVPTLVHFESTGRDNRIGVAATLGVAAVYTGVVAGAASLFPRPRWRRAAFGTGAGLLCAAAFVITNTQARFWVDAYDKQQQIGDQIASDVPALPRGGALILDGVCLEKGGAWVLTGARDLPGLLDLRYGAEQLRAATISRPVVVDPGGIHVKAFNSVAFFRYENGLVVYNYRRRSTYRLRNQGDAEHYFASRQFRPERDCPTVFAWGLEGR